MRNCSIIKPSAIAQTITFAIKGHQWRHDNIWLQKRALCWHRCAKWPVHHFTIRRPFLKLQRLPFPLDNWYADAFILAVQNRHRRNGRHFGADRHIGRNDLSLRIERKLADQIAIGGLVKPRSKGGFARGKAKIEGLEAYQGQTMTLNFQNEFLLAEAEDGTPLAITPDLICLLDLETGQPITTETMAYGYRVIVFGLPCDPKWRTEHGLELVGPGYFGYETDYQAIEDINK